LKSACFLQESNAADYRRLNRYLVLGVTRFDGEVAPYNSGHGPGAPMPQTDKAALHSVLLGKTVSGQQIVAAEASADESRGFLITRYADCGFAISYFDSATLLFMQNAAKDPEETITLRCLVNNSFLFLMMTRSLLHFFLWPETQSADDRSALGQMRGAAKQQILAIPERYKNPLCATWFQHYGPLQKLQAPDAKKS
jgi:hypothetical protein